MNLPSLTETVELIYSCIKSSQTSPQLAVCKEMIKKFIKERYEYYEDALTLEQHINELIGFINDRDKEIAYEAGKKAEHGLAA